MDPKRLDVFGCQDCIAGRERGHAPVWANEQGPTCERMIAEGRCGKALLARLIEQRMISIALVVDGQ